MHGAPSRNQPGQQSAEEEDDGRSHGDLYIHAGVFQDDVVTRNRQEQAVRQIEEEDAAAQSEEARHRRQHQAFAHDLRNDVERFCAQRPADANLLGTLLDRHHHDVAHANDARQERAHADNPNQDVDAEEKVEEGGEHLGEVDHHQRLRVVWGNVVGLEDDLLGLRDDSVHIVARQDAGRHQENLIAQVHALLQRAEGDEDALGGAPVDADVRRFRLGHAHHLVVEPVHADVFPARVAALEERLVDILADDAHLAPLVLVDLVQQPAEEGRHGLDAEIGGRDSFHMVRAALLPVDDVLVAACAEYHGGDLVDSFHFALDVRDVAVAQVPFPPFVESLVRDARAVGKEEEGIGGKTFRLAQHGILQSGTRAQQEDEHQNAPEDAEAGEEAPRLVAGDGDPYLNPSVSVE